jgi:hypothetical protein
MKFNDLTEKDIQYFTQVYKDKEMSWEDRMRILMKFIEKGSERTVRKWAINLGLKEREEEEPEQYKIAKQKKFDKSKKRVIITWAQNNTPVHERFLRNIEQYAKEINAEIHVIAGRYKNPTSIFTDKDYEHWEDRLEPYLDANRHNIHRYVSIMSDIKIQPTAVNPMTGLQGMSAENSCIFGGPKMQMETIPVLEGNKPKMMLTTGACTEPNYTDSKAGKKGEFHHMFGFVIVEIEEKKNFYVRQVTANDDGDFSDLYYRTTFKGTLEDVQVGEETYSEMFFGEWVERTRPKFEKQWVGDSTVTKLKKIAGIVFGDLHYGHHDQKVLDETMGMLNNIKPKTVILHDVFDGHSISHHERKDPFIQYQREMDGSNSLKKEVDEMLDNLRVFKQFKNVIIVRSNHDDFIDRWLKDIDWKKTTTFRNSLEYMEYASAILSGRATQGVVPYLINQRYPNFKTLDRSSSYKVKTWEVGQHGDVGANGSRGSLLQFRKLNTKVIVGHYHSPGRKDGAMAVGTSTHLRVGYNMGPSSWLQSHVIIHKDGKAQHINFVDGKFTTFKY